MATALELTRQQWQKYIHEAVQRPVPPPAADGEREAVFERVREAARQLKQQFGATRVVLFGSLAHAAWFAADSDVDLAVEGLAPDDFWEAWRAAEDIVRTRPVDLIDYQDAGDSLRKAIERYGIEL